MVGGSGELHGKKIGSVKADISSYGEKIFKANASMKKSRKNYPQRTYTKTRDTAQFSGSRNFAESELSAAKRIAKELTLKIEESCSRTETYKQDLEKLKGFEKSEEGFNPGISQYAKVIGELESVKQELSNLKLETASVSEQKRKVEKETESSFSRTRSCSSLFESINNKIEEINEEHMLVELARIEAVKEIGEIEARRKEQAEKNLTEIEEIVRKKRAVIQEIEDAEVPETKLAMTILDIEILESELNRIKKFDTGLERSESNRSRVGSNFQDEIEAAKNEINSIKEESFGLMESMDIVRSELKPVAEAAAIKKKKEEKTNRLIQNLDSKLLIAKTKMEEAYSSEEKVKPIVSNMLLSLEKLKSEAERAKKELSLVREENVIFQAQVHKSNLEIEVTGKRFEAAMQDLKAVKASESIALENLKSIIERTMRNRASNSQHKSRITISRLEYEYLTDHAAGAKEIADKKVLASRAWIDALKASERETTIKTKLLQKELREKLMEEDSDANRIIEAEFENWRQNLKPKKQGTEVSIPTTGTNRSIRMTPGRRAKFRGSPSPLVLGTPRSLSFTVRKKPKVMPNLAKFFRGSS